MPRRPILRRWQTRFVAAFTLAGAAGGVAMAAGSYVMCPFNGCAPGEDVAVAMVFLAVGPVTGFLGGCCYAALITYLWSPASERWRPRFRRGAAPPR